MLSILSRPIAGCGLDSRLKRRTKCYDWSVFNFGKPKTGSQWMAHVVLAIVALFLVWWMLRLYVL